jgi:uncharacterized protein YndB with AHSA1/START domain
VSLEDLVVEVEQVVPAPRDAVFALLSDPERTAGLGPEVTTCSWTSDERGVGATFTGTNVVGDFSWTVPCTVVAHDPPREFGWLVGDPAQPSATWTYLLSDDPAGTHVLQRFAHGPGRTFLRRAVTADPDRYDELVAERTASLQAGMRAVLTAVGEQLQG